MNTLKRSYLPPSMTVDEVQLESPICGGSVYDDKTEQKIEIKSQDFATDWNGDLSSGGWDSNTES